MTARTSILSILDTESGEVREAARFDHLIEAPNWLRDENKLLYNDGGRIYTLDLDSGAICLLDTGECTGCNNDHVLSPDGSMLAVSHGGMEGESYFCRIYTLPIGGGTPHCVTPNSPSFLHGWSPDGQELSYCAFRRREGRLAADIYTIPVTGGEERCLTDGGFNDGPEYSPDGNYIWFNSTRSGLMQIWRMRQDGSEQTQMTRTERNNWFAHPSPDGKKVVFLSYRKGDLRPEEHLPDLPVELWLMGPEGEGPHPVLSLFGGQGSINVNSWAPDSRRLAFVRYEPEGKSGRQSNP